VSYVSEWIWAAIVVGVSTLADATSVAMPWVLARHLRRRWPSLIGARQASATTSNQAARPGAAGLHPQPR